ncbi:MAG: hypothetical protein JSS82_16380 [Bacteroidetes bacterium]|nr:hypothetical protein [Bacteroidota bacterium]
MKQFCLLAIPLFLTFGVKAQDIDKNYMDAEYRMPGKLNKMDVQPRVDGFDREADKALFAEPYTSADNRQHLNSTPPVKVQKGLYYQGENTNSKTEQHPMLPWQKAHPLLRSKRDN